MLLSSANRIPYRLLTIPVALLLTQSLASLQAAAQSLTPGTSLPITIVHAFGADQTDGEDPSGKLVQSPDGNFYGVTRTGGVPFPGGHGTIFRTAPDGTTKILHRFQDGSVANDGSNPSAGLTLGTDGNFYGTTSAGGSTARVLMLQGYGTVFQMTPSGTVKILHSFADGSIPGDGKTPSTPLIQGEDGNFYGTTFEGGVTSLDTPNGFGTIFKITPTGVMTVLHTFQDGSVVNDGKLPSSLTLASDGNFYGTTSYGGATNDGAVFKMTPSGALTILHSFAYNDFEGAVPNCIIQASDGNFYGTTVWGSPSSTQPGPTGTVFEMAPAGNVTTLHWFRNDFTTREGTVPASIVQASDGNFYGTCIMGGDGSGTIFSITPAGSLTILHLFNVSSISDGSSAESPFTQGFDGKLYGTAGVGGPLQFGMVFSLSADLPLPVPAAPANVKAVAGTSQVTLSWTASPGATSYDIYRGSTSGGESPHPIATGIAGTTFVNTGLTNGTTYYYRLRAKSATGAGMYSSEVSATPQPAAPTGLTATAGNTQITLAWTASAGAASYNIYRGTAPGAESATPIATGITSTSYVNNGLINGSAYYYVVAAVNGGSVSTKSNEAWTKPQPPVPAAPKNLATTRGNSQVSLSWTASAGATSYKVYRSTTPGGETAIAGVTTTTYINTGLTNGKTYYYKIAAVNGGGLSPQSNEASATPAP